MPCGNYEIPGPSLNKELCSSRAITRSKKATVPGRLLKGTSAERGLGFRPSVGKWTAGHGPGRACGWECLKPRYLQPGFLWKLGCGWLPCWCQLGQSLAPGPPGWESAIQPAGIFRSRLLLDEQSDGIHLKWLRLMKSLQYSLLGNPMDRESWLAVAYGVQESDRT